MDQLTSSLLSYIPKVLAVVAGAIFSLVLSGDIDTKGRVKITLSLVIKLNFAMLFSLYAGEAFIEIKSYQHLSSMTQGFIMMVFALFGVLIIGIIYQAIRMLHGKTLSEIAEEVGKVIEIILRRKK